MFFENALAIPMPSCIDVFPELPEPCSSTFVQGIPQTQENPDYIDVIVLYEADLRLICSLDNTASDASTTYVETVTLGFAFTAGQKVSISSSCSVDLLIAKSTVTLSLEVNFSEQWNKSTTTSTSVTVAGRKKAYFYQAAIRSRILRFNLKTLEYKYLPSEGVFTAKRFVSVDEPLKMNEKARIETLVRKAGSRLPLWLRIGAAE